MKKVLIVNNDIDTMSLLSKWLKKKHYESAFTGDPEEMKEILNDFKPNLVIVDVLRKDVIPKIKEHNKKTPIILMTGYAKVELVHNLNVDDIIEKPFNLEVLENKLDKLLL